jgi:hypothetical protein
MLDKLSERTTAYPATKNKKASRQLSIRLLGIRVDRPLLFSWLFGTWKIVMLIQNSVEN